MSPARKKLLTLSEVSRKTGISMPTLQKYKRLHAAEIPSEGEGRKQRYYLESLEVFRRLKREGVSRRGRRPKAKSSATRGSASKSTAKALGSGEAASSAELISLQEVMRQTKISYPTLLRYVKLHLEQLPHEGTGRRRRYYPEAVEVFRELRRTSKRGRRPKAASAAGTRRSAVAQTSTAVSGKGIERRMADLERSHLALERQLRELISVLRAPMTVTVRRS